MATVPTDGGGEDEEEGCEGVDGALADDEDIGVVPAQGAGAGHYNDYQYIANHS